ncbi:MAG: efflux RND transporter periplasmic adaptor subunit [Rhodospirillales bacterium]|nr:MAG: efflux RND transporter periplasmic adaptor subunit [Rhodospirillales bacterium]
MKRSYLIALVIAVAATGWLLSPYVLDYLRPGTGSETADQQSPPQPSTDSASGRSAPALRVRVRRSIAEERIKSLILTGQTEPSRQATLKAETSGRIVAIEAREGAAVKAGDVIARIEMDDRKARLEEARALLKQRQIEYEAARKLSSKGFQTQIRLAESQSQMESAKALLRRIELDIEHTTIRAPFDGVLQDRLVEIGDYTGVGDPVAVIVDLDPILAVGQLSERESGFVRPDNEGRARLVTGEVIEGRVSYVSAVGAAGTRTFRVELELENGDARIPAGLTAEISLPIASVAAHQLSPAALTLDDAGVVGVKTVDADNIVRFHPVELVAGGADGMWISGLPREAAIITVGQEFVLPGQTVVPVPEDMPAPPAGAAAGGQS